MIFSSEWHLPPAPELRLDDPGIHVACYGTQIVGCGPFELFDDITRAKEHYAHHLPQHGVERVSRVGFDVRDRYELSDEEADRFHVPADCEKVIRVWCARVPATTEKEQQP